MSKTNNDLTLSKIISSNQYPELTKIYNDMQDSINIPPNEAIEKLHLIEGDLDNITSANKSDEQWKTSFAELEELFEYTLNTLYVMVYPENTSLAGEAAESTTEAHTEI